VYDLARLFEGPAWERTALAVVAAVLAPVCEEIAFRGYLQTTLALRRGPAVAIGAGAFLFALLHLDPIRFPALLLLGAVFGWIAWRTGSVWPSVAAHATNNGIAAALLLLVGRPEDSSPPGASATAGALLLGGGALAYVLVRVREAAGPEAPRASDAVVLRDPSWPSIRFHPGRVPRPLRRAAVAGTAVLFGLAAVGVLRALARGP
jgi:hypothetical protein